MAGITRFAMVSTAIPAIAPLAPLFFPASLSPMIPAAILPSIVPPFANVLLP